MPCIPQPLVHVYKRVGTQPKLDLQQASAFRNSCWRIVKTICLVLWWREEGNTFEGSVGEIDCTMPWAVA